jgi:hypothetical protein
MKCRISVAIIFLFSFSCLSQSDLNIIYSNSNSFLFEYTPIINDLPIAEPNNEEYINITLKGGFYINHTPGTPQIPSSAFTLGVPDDFGNTIQIVSSSFKEIKGKILPVPVLIKSSGITVNKNDKEKDYYNFNSIGEDLVSFGESGMMRNSHVQTFIIHPIQFNSNSGIIRIYTKLRVKISFSSRNTNQKAEYDDLLSSAILNYSVAKEWGTVNNKLKKQSVINSVLSSGKWYKFEASNEGIYKITKSMLSSYGIDPNSVDPRTIKIYNNGGRTLPEAVNSSAPTDLVENAIYIQGESDGKFDDTDYILFYGRGTNFWAYDSLSHKIVRRYNPYSKENFYWITSGGDQGRRMKLKSSAQIPADYIQNSTPAFAYLNQEKINLAHSGRFFVGDEFNSTTIARTYTTKLDGIIPGSKINYLFNYINGFHTYVELKVEESGTKLFDQLIPGWNSYYDSTYACGYPTTGSASYYGNLTDNRSLLKFTFNALESGSKGYINWFEIYYNKTLTPVDNQLLFYSKDTSANIKYDLSGFPGSNIRVFDISDYSNVKIISNPLVLSGGEFKFVSSEIIEDPSEYLAIGDDNFKLPVNPVEVSNSNLHGFQDGAKLIIITPKEFEDQALRLKSFKENHPNLNISTYVADIDKIFNEFSCGMTDVAGIRNFIKYAFDNWTIKPENVLLFGDGTYDYKNIEHYNNNFIPPYETLDFLNLLDSYPSDDFYVRVKGEDGFIDLGIGRLNINSLSDARIIVDKIIAYETGTDKGNWQNLITLLADDNIVPRGYDLTDHVLFSEDLCSYQIPLSFDLNKIYEGAYPTVNTGIGATKPAAAEDLIKSINNGTLILNYYGHGNEHLLADERVFENEYTIPQLKNSKLFFMTAATCEFGYYDKTTSQCGAELLVLKENSGAIGVFAAARPVYADQNKDLNERLYSGLLSHKRDTLNLPFSTGKAYFLAKSIRYGQNDQIYHLYCDPSLRLAVPQFAASIDSVNSVSTNKSIQVKALSTTNVTGTIRKADNTPWTDFSGEGVLTIYDSERHAPLEYQKVNTVVLQGGIIFKGRITIKNGIFNSSFVVPKDISYENKNGKVVLFFYNNTCNGVGFSNNIIVGGTDTNSVNNRVGPEIEIYFDDITYKNSLMINPDSKLIVRLFDSNGLNTTGTGIGHKIEGILNDDQNNPIDFTNYFTGDLDAGGKSGEVNYQFNQLQEGHYKLQVKAWDVFNNFSTASAFFDVVSSNDLEIRDIYNYPNPFSGKTTFTFQQNLNRQLDVKIKVFTVAGRMIKEIDRFGVNDRFVTVEWDGKDHDGTPVANGVYFYKVILKSGDGQLSRSVIGKLAVIR